MVISKDDSANQPNSKPLSAILGYPLEKGNFTQRAMSMRKFLEPFDHSSLTDRAAGDKYAAYKASFVRQQLEEFFERNKGHAWFREKYHPDLRLNPESSKKLLQHRLEVFMELFQSGLLDKVRLTSAFENDIIRLLDIVAIKLAGGTDEDIELLDRLYETNASKAMAEASTLPDTTDAQFETNANKPSKDQLNSPVSKSDSQTNIRKSRSKSKRKVMRKGADKKSTTKHKNRNQDDEEEEGEDSSLSDSSQSSSASASEASQSDGRSSSSSSSSSNSSSSSSSDSESESPHRESKPDVTQGHSRASKPASTRASSSSSSRSSHSSSSSSSSDNDEDQEDGNQRAGRTRKNRQSSNCKSTEARTIAQDSDQRQTEVPRSRKSAPGSESHKMPNQVHTNRDTSGNFRKPIHCTSTLFLPHIPFSVYRKDLIALFSTSPHFLRLAVMDPVIMPQYKSKLDQITDPIFGSKVTESPTNPSPTIVFRRMGWATFCAQVKQSGDTNLDDKHQDPKPGDANQTDYWVDIDLESICNNLIQQALDAQAPAELIECLRSARIIHDHACASASDRIKTESYLWHKLLTTCPNRFKSKALMRRHLVLAASLVYELDRARQLWGATTKSTDDEQPKTESGLDGNALSKDSNENQLNESGPGNEEKSDHSDDELMDTSDPNPNHSQVSKSRLESLSPSPSSSPSKKQQEPPAPTSSSKADSSLANITTQPCISFDPEEDLLKAATILGNLDSPNPILKGLIDYLVDEGNAEEELLLSGVDTLSLLQPSSNPSYMTSRSFPFDDPIVNESDNSDMSIALDRLILYLRIVHSVDFYAPAIYTNEDAMPHPCRLIHVRPSLAQINKALDLVKTLDPLQNGAAFEKVFAEQLKRIVNLLTPLEEPKCGGLGLRDVQEVVEAFIKANTRRKKRKTDVIWVCPLSNKKFRDPIYVKKHIMNKHLDKVEAVKKDSVYFFNNYVMDPSRPQLPMEPRIRRTRSVSRSRSNSAERERTSDRESTAGQPRFGSRDHSSNQAPDNRWQSFGNRSREPSDSYGAVQSTRDFTGPNRYYSHRPYGRPPYNQFRAPYSYNNANFMRNRYNGPNMPYFGGGMRRGNPRRAYVDLDAP